MLQITPNGSRERGFHPALPLTLDELLADLRACLAAGAGGVHLHVRDTGGRETLAPGPVNATVSAVRALARELDVPVEVGLTTGAWIVPDVAERIAMIREWEGVDCATVNLSEPGFERVMDALTEAGIGVDVGLWAPQEVGLLIGSGHLTTAQRVSIELSQGEPHRLTGDPRRVAADVNAALDAAGSTCPRLTHGDGDWTWPLVADALARGHDTRVGFEDDARLPSGRVAACNAELVRAAVALGAGVAG